MFDDQIQSRPIPPRLLADLAATEVHETEPAYLEMDAPVEPVRIVSMGVAQAEAEAAVKQFLARPLSQSRECRRFDIEYGGLKVGTFTFNRIARIHPGDAIRAVINALDACAVRALEMESEARRGE